MTNTGPPPANGGKHATRPTPGEPVPNTIPQAGQAAGPPPGAAPGEEGPPVPRPAAALIDIALQTGPFLSMGRPVGRNSVLAGFGIWRNGAASGGPGRPPWA